MNIIISNNSVQFDSTSPHSRWNCTDTPPPARPFECSFLNTWMRQTPHELVCVPGEPEWLKQSVKCRECPTLMIKICSKQSRNPDFNILYRDLHSHHNVPESLSLIDKVLRSMRRPTETSILIFSSLRLSSRPVTGYFPQFPVLLYPSSGKNLSPQSGGVWPYTCWRMKNWCMGGGLQWILKMHTAGEPWFSDVDIDRGAGARASWLGP